MKNYEHALVIAVVVAITLWIIGFCYRNFYSIYSNVAMFLLGVIILFIGIAAHALGKYSEKKEEKIQKNVHVDSQFHSCT